MIVERVSHDCRTNVSIMAYNSLGWGCVTLGHKIIVSSSHNDCRMILGMLCDTYATYTYTHSRSPTSLQLVAAQWDTTFINELSALERYSIYIAYPVFYWFPQEYAWPKFQNCWLHIHNTRRNNDLGHQYYESI